MPVDIAAVEVVSSVAEAQAAVVGDTYFGRFVADPYRHLEDLDAPESRAWLDREAQRAREILGGLRGRDSMLARLEEIDAATPRVITGVSRLANGDLCYLERPAGADVARLCCREAATGEVHVLVDPATLATDSAAGHMALELFVVSPDGRHVLYGIAASGSEDTALRIFDRHTGTTLPETIERIEAIYLSPCWLPDGRSFVYSQRRPPAEVTAEAEGLADTQAMIHVLGTCPTADRCVFGSRAPGSPPLEPLDFPAILITPGSPWAVGQVRHGDEADLTLYATRLESLGQPDVGWRRICNRTDLVTAYGVHGADIYLLTADGAPRHKILRTPLAAPDFALATTVFEPVDAVAESLAIAADGVYVGVIDRATQRVVRLPFAGSGRAEPLVPPGEDLSAAVFDSRADLPGVLVRTASWIREGRILSHDPARGTWIDVGLTEPGEFSRPEGLVAREVMVPSHDGIEVPLSIVHRADLTRDGTAPTLLVGYGAYGFTDPMAFAPQRLAWLERGGVFAVAHVRGGGAFGKAWHLAGRKASKPNTWKDFIACGEYLVREGYASPATLCGQGRSAGGILIGRAVTDRPDLFVAANVGVGCTDMLRFETTMNGPPNIPEFGTVTKPEEFAGLLAMSTLHHVQDGVAYPAILFTHGRNDPRVAPWQSAKTAARFQAATAGPRPVVLRIEDHAGHGLGSTRRQVREETADIWSFFLWQCGHPDFR